MAHGLAISKIRIDQTLHGYSDGHRLLASSMALKPRDQRTMLMMSDVSGPNAVISDDGYLTGYPLADSGVYALARTWAATEMARPGCVWTHTLLIGFADLAVLPTMRFLLGAFHRPGGPSAFSDFERRLDIQGAGDDFGVPPNEEALTRMLSALYSHPNDRIIASCETVSSDVVLSLWAQQWPRLRRAFRFCTLTFSDRSNDGNAFDLQLIPSKERSLRTRFSGSTDADRLNSPEGEWLRAALADLLEGSTGKIRKFLRDVGGDLSGGREAFIPLCRLHGLINQFSSRGASIEEAVSLVDNSFGETSGNSLRLTIFEAIAKSSSNLGPAALAFLLKHLDLLEQPGLMVSLAELARAIWQQSPEQFVTLLNGPPSRSTIAEQGLAALSASELLQGLERIPEETPTILSKRPELTEERNFWKLFGRWADTALSIASKDSNRTQSTLAALMEADRSDLAPNVVRILGIPNVLQMISHWPSGALQAHSDTVLALITAAVKDSSSLARTLSDHLVDSRMLLMLIARNTSPDYVPNAFGEDPWWSSVRDSRDDLDEVSRQYLCSYLLSRGLGHISRNQADLIQFSFDQVYIPASRSALSMDASDVLEARLPRPWWFEWNWDYCQRLREAVVEAFVDRDLATTGFAWISKDDEIFRQLTELAARTGRGRRYLKKVVQTLVYEDAGSARSDIVREAL